MTITFQDIRDIQKTGDFKRIRQEAAVMHRQGIVWSDKKLHYILKTLGEPGIIAALNAKTVKHAAKNIAATNAYKTPSLATSLWTKPELATLWSSVCGQNSGHLVRFFNFDSSAMLWSAVACHADPDIERATQRYKATQVGVGGKPDPEDLFTQLLCSITSSRSVMFEVIIHTAEIAALLKPRTNLNKKTREDETHLGVLIMNTSLIGQRRMGSILKLIEEDCALLKQADPFLFHFAQCAISANAPSVLKTILSWGRDNPIVHPEHGGNLLASGLLLPNGTGDWKKRWSVLNIVGADNPQLLTDALSTEAVWDGLIGYVRQLGDRHCFETLHGCALAGVDLLNIKKDGVDIVMSAKEAREESTSSALALIEQHVLSNATAATNRATGPRRRI